MNDEKRVEFVNDGTKPCSACGDGDTEQKHHVHILANDEKQTARDYMIYDTLQLLRGATNEEAVRCVLQGFAEAYAAERTRERDTAWIIRLGEFRQALNEADLHGHYNLLQQFFGEGLERELEKSAERTRPLEARVIALEAAIAKVDASVCMVASWYRSRKAYKQTAAAEAMDRAHEIIKSAVQGKGEVNA